MNGASARPPTVDGPPAGLRARATELERRVRSSRLRPAFRAAGRARAAVRARRSPFPDAPPVIVLTSARSGSGLLCELLRQHPDVGVGGEPLSTKTDDGIAGITDPARIQRHLRHRLAAQQVRVPGVKVFHAHLEDQGLQVDDLVAWFGDLRPVLLYRESIAEQYVSWLSARQNRQWWLEQGRERRAAPPLSIDPDRFRRFRERERRRVHDAHRRLEAHGEPCVVRYEDVARDPAPVIESLWRSFGVEPVELRSTHRQRQRTYRHLSERIANWDEVQSLLEDPESRLPPPG